MRKKINNKIKQKLHNKLKTANIEENKYIEVKNKLITSFGYDNDTADKLIIITISKSNTDLNVAITYADKFKNLGFNSNHIYKIIHYHALSLLVLNNIYDNYTELHNILSKELKYSKTQQQLKLNTIHNDIATIASFSGGLVNIKSFIDNYDKLRKLLFTRQEIISIVSHCGGSKNIAAVIENYEQLSSLKFSCAQITKVVATDGGSKNIAAIIENYTELKHMLNDNNTSTDIDKQNIINEQISKMAGNHGGAMIINTFLKKYNQLKQLGFTIEEIVSISSFGGSVNNINFVINNHHKLITLNLDNQDITKLTSKNSCEQKLNYLINDYNEFKKLGCTDQQIKTICKRPLAKKTVSLSTHIKNCLASFKKHNLNKNNSNDDDYLEEFNINTLDNPVEIDKLSDFLGLYFSDQAKPSKKKTQITSYLDEQHLIKQYYITITDAYDF